MNYSITYPATHRKALKNIEHSVKKHDIAECISEKSYNRNSFAHFLSKIKLEENRCSGLIYEDVPGYNLADNSLKYFIQKECNGRIGVAIDKISAVAKYICKEIEPTSNHKQLADLQFISFFLRDIESILYKEKYSERPSDQLNIINYQNCLGCHRSRRSTKTFCDVHTRSSGNAADVKSLQRTTINAFNNLRLKTDYDGEYKKIKIKLRASVKKNDSKNKKIYASKLKRVQNKMSISKYRRLNGWSRTHPLQNLFTTELNTIIRKYCPFHILTEWNDSSITMFNEIIALTKTFEHTSNIFHEAFSCGLTNEDFKNKLNSQVFRVDDESLVDYPDNAVYTIEIMGQFSLIKMASNKKSLEQVRENKNYVYPT